MGRCRGWLAVFQPSIELDECFILVSAINRDDASLVDSPFLNEISFDTVGCVSCFSWPRSPTTISNYICLSGPLRSQMTRELIQTHPFFFGTDWAVFINFPKCNVTGLLGMQGFTRESSMTVRPKHAARLHNSIAESERRARLEAARLHTHLTRDKWRLMLLR